MSDNVIYGTLIDVFGTGVLMTGKSGIGKSETALELIHRGHRLIADDSVEISVVDGKVYGECPEVIKHFMEIRGVGVIDINAIFGVGAVIDRKRIELVIEMEAWDDNKEYERLGMTTLETEIAGVKLSKLLIPVMPGRNMAIVTEVAAKDFRLKQSGYNAAKEINKRLNIK